jgi:hypothetical protein
VDKQRVQYKGKNMKSDTLKIYLDSPFGFTAREMAKMTPEQLAFADSVYVEAEANYSNGGDWIVEAMEPWELVKMFKNLAQARQHWEMVEDYAKDIQNA